MNPAPISSPPIRPSVLALDAYVPGEQRPVPNLVKLNTNENPYPPSPAVAATLSAFPAAALARYPDPACTALRRRLAELHGCSPENIIVGNGSDEVLRLATRAFTLPGGSIATFDPSYSLYPVLAAAEELTTRRVPLAPGFAWADPSPADLADATLFFLTNPNAPTGVLYPDAPVEAFARAFPGTLLVDEAYADFADAETCGVRLADSLPNVLACRTFSKSWSLAGLRCGYAIGHPDLIGALYKLKDSYNNDRIAQAIALAALSDVPWMRENARKIRATRQRVADALRARGFAVIPSQSNFLFVRPPAPDTADALFARLREHKILVRHFPASPLTAPFLRVSIGTDAQMDAFLQASLP
jgi:histidinol-phosphate aminotransferase